MTDPAWPEFDGSDPGGPPDGQAENPEAPDPDPPTGWPDVELDQQGRTRERFHGGRPTLYTTPRVLAILAALFGGASRADAARRAGVRGLDVLRLVAARPARVIRSSRRSPRRSPTSRTRGGSTWPSGRSSGRRFWKVFP